MKVKILILEVIILTGIKTYAQQNIIDSLIHQEYQRNYTLHLPTNYNNSKSTPLVVFLHGGGGNALSAQRFTGFNQVSNQNSFLVAYPEAHYESKPNSFIWADGRNTAADKSGIDDIGFINKLLDTLIFDYNIDTNRIYLCGFSNGSFLTQRMAFVSNNRFAAMGTLGSTVDTFNYYNQNPDRAIPMVFIFGTKDPFVPYNGGVVAESATMPVVGVEPLVNYWKNQNDCKTTLDSVNLPNLVQDDNSTVTVFEYKDCHCSSNVKFYKINNGGHTWPGIEIERYETIAGETNEDIHAAYELWDFFNAHTLNNNTTGINKNTEDRSFSYKNMVDAARYSENMGGAAVMIMQNDSIVFEAYHNGADSNTATHIHSATKGFWSLIAAHSLETGIFESYDELVANTITEWQDFQQHPLKRQIRIKQLLSLSSGLSQDVTAIQGIDTEAYDIYQYVVDSLDVNFVPGNKFQYGPSHYYAFGVLLKRKLHNKGILMNPLEYLDSIIFQAIGFEYEKWAYDGSGNPHIPNGCFTTPQNWMKFGKLLLHKGSWNGTQLVDSNLVKDLFIHDGPNPGHGKFLWLNKVDGQGASVRHVAPPGSPGGFMYHNGFTEIIGALGAGKNRMYIIPSLNAVILRQTLQERDDYEDHTFLSFLLEDFIVSIEEVAVEICDNDSIFLENAWQTEAGTYFDTLTTLAGYDSILVTKLKVNSRYYRVKEKEICDGDSVLWQDNYISQAGTYYDTLTSVNGCDSIFELDLTVIPLPNVDLGPNTKYCFGEFVALMVDDSHAYYEWSDNTTGTYAITLDSTDYTIGSNEFYVIVTSEEGCVNSDSVLIDIETCSNIKSFQEKLIHIYPNPSGEILIIRSVSPEEYEIAEIITQNGQVLFSRSMDKYNQVNKFNISSLTEGIYFLKLIKKDKVKTYKFVKK